METKTSQIVVQISAPTADEARVLAEHAIAQKLAACVHLFPIQSWYEWEGKVVHDNEYLVLMKTRADLYEALETCICTHHSYDVPEILVLPIQRGYAPYLQWIDQLPTQMGDSPEQNT